MSKSLFIGLMIAVVGVLAIVLSIAYGGDWDKNDDKTQAEESSGAVAAAGAPPQGFERLIPINGTENLRDLGGYETTDGKWTKTGVLYRSDSLENVVDPEELRKLDLVTIFDFRSHDEIEEGPNRLPQPNDYRLVNYPIGNPEDLAELLPAEVLEGTTVEELRKELTDLYLAGDFDQMDAVLAGWNIDIAEERRKRYVDFVSIHAHTYANLFEEILIANGQPLLFHCHGGKDRTGVGAALVLLALGVPKETAMEDYLKTNDYTNVEELRKHAPASLLSVIGAHEDQLEAAMGWIDENYDSFDDYRREKLMFDDEKMEEMKTLLLA